VLHPANSRERDKAIKGEFLQTLDLKKDAILNTLLRCLCIGLSYFYAYYLKQYILNNTLNNILNYINIYDTIQTQITPEFHFLAFSYFFHFISTSAVHLFPELCRIFEVLFDIFVSHLHSPSCQEPHRFSIINGIILTAVVIVIREH